VYYASDDNQIVSLTNQKHILGKVPTRCHGFLMSYLPFHVRIICVSELYVLHSIFKCIYIYIHICMYVYTYMYIHWMGGGKDWVCPLLTSSQIRGQMSVWCFVLSDINKQQSRSLILCLNIFICMYAYVCIIYMHWLGENKDSVCPLLTSSQVSVPNICLVLFVVRNKQQSRSLSSFYYYIYIY
jgi:hypothetical protein